MAFPVNGVIETFTGTDATTPPNANWTNGIQSFGGGDGIEIISNAVRRNVGTNPIQDAYWNPGDFGPDCEVYATVSAVGTANAEGVLLYARMVQIGAGTVDGYNLRVRHSAGVFQDWNLFSLTNGSSTLLGSALFSRSDGTNQGAGKIGLGFVQSQVPRADDFGGGTVVPTSVIHLDTHPLQRLKEKA